MREIPLTQGKVAIVGADTLADVIDFPSGGDPWVVLQSDERRFVARFVLRWLLDDIGGDGIAVKVIALRFLFGMEPRSMQSVAKRYGVTRQAISKQANALADSLGIPHLRSATSRENYRRAQLNAWKKRKAKLHGDNGQI